LNKLPEVKAWIVEAKQYPKVTIEYTHGEPIFFFYDADGEQVGDAVRVSRYTKDGIHSLLASHGLQRII